MFGNRYNNAKATYEVEHKQVSKNIYNMFNKNGTIKPQKQQLTYITSIIANLRSKAVSSNYEYPNYKNNNIINKIYNVNNNTLITFYNQSEWGENTRRSNIQNKTRNVARKMFIHTFRNKFPNLKLPKNNITIKNIINKAIQNKTLPKKLRNTRNRRILINPLKKMNTT